MKKILLSFIAALAIFPAFAVTDKEMDEAKAITAKLYLRWANDASGYLDELNPKSMAELTAKLKDKEKENLKAFNAVSVPSDYAGWSKEKFVEYWSSTFFNSPGLSDAGKRARGRVKIKLSAMNVSAPTAATTPAPAADTASAGEAVPEEILAAEEASKQSQEDILNDQQAIAKDAEEASDPVTPQEQSHTWVYILVLAILVAVVVWLVVYAANLMKRQPGAEEEERSEKADSELREQTRKAISKKNEEVEEVKQRLHTEEERNAELGMELERLKLENKRMAEQIDKLRTENGMLRKRPQVASAPEPAPKPAEEKPILKVIYLGRANSKGIFVRADRRINPGNTIYRLDTNDGLVGTFHVVDEPEVVETAISRPLDYLGYGCSADNIEDTAGVTRIITESPGTAIFENGYWKILRKTRIRYE